MTSSKLGFSKKPQQLTKIKTTREQRTFANRVTALTNIKCLPGDLLLPGDKVVFSSETKKIVSELDVLQIAKFEAEIVLYLQALAQVYLLKKGLEAEWGFTINKVDLILSYIPGRNLKIYTLAEWDKKIQQGINPREQ